MNIPEGWKLVPAEPTLGMAEAGAVSTGDNVDGRPVWKATIDEQAAHIYRAMLSVAPTPPVQRGEPVGWLESPHGQFRANPLFRLTGPQSISWSFPVFLAPPAQDDEVLEVLKLALETMTCGDTGDDLEDSHRCGKCDEYVDRNAVVRQRIHTLLTKRGAG